jgi:hypothetical protein
MVEPILNASRGNLTQCLPCASIITRLYERRRQNYSIGKFRALLSLR